jgi:sec-independent protein translocase protein TatB|tara:strand:+ start:1257 stop:1502 length:246 start_codon:yes stop_codon:yes gene_type:complete
MPQIGWLEILAIVIIAILVLGPKEFPVALKKIGSYFGKLKNTLSNFQREVNSVTENIDIEKELTDKKITQEKNNKTEKDNE